MTRSTRLVSAAVLIAALGLAAAPVLAQQAGQQAGAPPPARQGPPGIAQAGEISHQEMERRWGGAIKTGVSAAGPEEDKTAINAPDVQPGYKMPRHSDGTPDLSGTWSNASNTALRRPGNFKNLVMTDDEAVKAREDNPQNIRQATDDKQKESDGLLTGKDLAAGRGYNSFWIDPGNNYAMVKGTWRTSWIVEPANGQMPMKPRSGGARPVRLGNGYDNPEERN